MSERDAVALDVVVAVSRALTGEADLTSILDLVARQGRALVRARALAVEVREDGGIVVAAVAGELPEGVDAARERAGNAALMVPLALRGHAYGALVAIDRQGEEGSRFTVEDEEILEALATLVAGALAAQKLNRAQRPEALDHVGLTGAIELLADLVESPKMEIRTRLDLAFGEGRAENRLDGKVETAAYRIVQEALTSIVKCSGASQVLVEVVEDDGREELRIEVCAFGGEGTRVTATLPSGRRRRSMGPLRY